MRAAKASRRSLAIAGILSGLVLTALVALGRDGTRRWVDTGGVRGEGVGSEGGTSDLFVMRHSLITESIHGRQMLI